MKKLFVCSYLPHRCCLPRRKRRPRKVRTLDHGRPVAARAGGQSDAASDPHHIAVKQLADFPNDAFLLAHREADGQVEWHETQIDIFFVQSGSATLVVGGTYLNGETVAPHEKA